MIMPVFAFFGLCLGSFVNAWVWRTYKQRMTTSKKVKQEYSIVHGRSMCIHCRHRLELVDLIPLFSWLALSGKCRYCNKSISWQYPLVELVGAFLFLVSYMFWPFASSSLNNTLLGLWLVELVVLLALAVFDLRWRLLPNKMVIILLVPAVVGVILALSTTANLVLTLVELLSSALIGGGIFWVIFQISNGKWIGGGDVKLGAVLGLILGSPTLAFMMIFLASIFGTILALPFLTSGKLRMKVQLPFGPFLILATVTLKLFGASLIVWYKLQTGI